MTIRAVLIEDERIQLVDRQFSGELYHAAREYFVFNEKTKLSDAWADTAITMKQSLYDYYDDETGETTRSKMDFGLQIVALRKRDGVRFYDDIVVPVELKGYWEIIREHFHISRNIMEELAVCECNKIKQCDRHSHSDEPQRKNESVLRV